MSLLLAISFTYGVPLQLFVFLKPDFSAARAGRTPTGASFCLFLSLSPSFLPFSPSLSYNVHHQRPPWWYWVIYLPACLPADLPASRIGHRRGEMMIEWKGQTGRLAGTVPSPVLSHSLSILLSPSFSATPCRRTPSPCNPTTISILPTSPTCSYPSLSLILTL